MNPGDKKEETINDDVFSRSEQADELMLLGGASQEHSFELEHDGYADIMWDM